MSSRKAFDNEKKLAFDTGFYMWKKRRIKLYKKGNLEQMQLVILSDTEGNS